MPRSRVLAAAVLALMAFVLGTSTLHVHPHVPGPASPEPAVSAHEEDGQGPGSCPLCRIAQQPTSADAVAQGAGSPTVHPVLLAGEVVEQPRRSSCTSALPRAPPAPSPIS